MFPQEIEVFQWGKNVSEQASLLYVSDTRRWINVGLPLVHRLRRRANVKPTMIQRLVSAGQCVTSISIRVASKSVSELITTPDDPGRLRENRYDLGGYMKWMGLQATFVHI